MASTIKVDKIEGSTGSTITVPTGQTLTLTDGLAAASLPVVGVAKGGTNLSSFTAGDVLYATGSTTLAKLAKGTAEQVLAMNSGATAPDWGSVDLTVLPTITVAKGGTNLTSFTAGDILYATGATTLAKLAKGTTLQHLRMNAGATAPEWTAAPSGGAWNLLSHQSASNVALIEFSSLFTTDYDIYKVYIANLQGMEDARDLYAQWRQSGSYLTSGYRYGAFQAQDGTTINGDGSTSAGHMKLTRDATGYNVTGERSNWEITLGDPLATDKTKIFCLTGGNINQDSSLRIEFGAASGCIAATGTMDGIKFYMSSGNIGKAEFSLFGLAQA